MPEPAKQQEHREEAKRLAQLPRSDQRELIAMHRAIAKDPKVPKAERRAGLARADSLERLLKLTGKKEREK
ncbi:MAG: hypothetical protein HY040_18665 [Planctomycetes bacterium]|nr:hypothetical protein [Planctomycetota bacterium]